MDRRPLYLDPSEPTRVALEPPALAIRRGAGSVRYAPLSRLARVVVRGPVAIETPALLACLDAGIPVLFRGAAGDLRGLCLGESGAHACPWPSHWDELGVRPDWQAAYANWRAAERQRAIRQVAERTGVPIARCHPKQARLRLHRWHRARMGGDARDRSREAVRALTGGLAAQQIVEAGWAGPKARGLGGHPDLVSDLADILAWHAEPWLAELAAGSGPREWVTRFSQREPALIQAGVGFLGRFQAFLETLPYECP